MINFGESLVNELSEHKDISMIRVARQISQLGIKFNHDVIGKLREVVDCEVVEGVQIDEGELSSMEEMMREASSEPPQPNVASSQDFLTGRVSNMTDAVPITRSSLAALTGDENDLLSESPVFTKAKNVGVERPLETVMNPRASTSVPVEIPEEPLDVQLVNEINDYLQGIMEDGSPVIEMSDSPIRSQGAECVAAAITFCEAVVEVKLADCEIKDAGAIILFGEFAKSKSVEFIDLSGNLITERCFDAIESCLTQNAKIKQVLLQRINVKSNFAWGKFKKFGGRVKYMD